MVAVMGRQIAEGRLASGKKEGRKEGRKDWGWDGCGTDRYASRQRKQYNVVLLFHTMSIDKKAFFI
jgi:hypothetical protein